jgi:hypothetical protein
MNIEPTYTSVGNLFGYRPMFFIPKYQRAYAWTSDSVSDFINDLKTCFEKRKSNDSMAHFFGGILSVQHRVTGAFNQHKYEIIDGQQRIATFTLLVACLIKFYNDLEAEAKSTGDSTNESIIKGRIEKLTERFIEFNQEVQRRTTSVEVLELSKADDVFYKELIHNMNPVPSRDSHHKILKAYSDLSDFVGKIVNSTVRIEDKIDNLEIIQDILDNDFTILHMVTDNRNDAFRLFQVINDRGTNLTDGDLLRAKTLELLEGFQQQQDAVERLWDEILVDTPSETNNYLNWIYESYQGNRPQQNVLFDLFRDKFFPQHLQLNLTLHDAQQIYLQVKNIHEEIIKCRKLVQGQWLYAEQQPVTGWDRSRLSILLVELGHTLSIPLFLAASKLDHRIFSEIVQIVERAFFRYKLICNQHVTPLKAVYYQEALVIRQNPASYSTATLKSKLQALITTKAADQIFCNNLSTLEYQESGNNKPLKYFLMAIEYYYQWYKNGGVGAPVCVDKSRIYDFAGTSIEHIYPRNALVGDIDSSIEPLKNTLGNSTIMDPAQNNVGSNDNFNIKRLLYQVSSVVLTQEIGAKSAWTKSEIKAHKALLIDAALKIFRT